MPPPRVGVFALGSDHGDDRAAWEAVRLAADVLPADIEVVYSNDPLALTAQKDHRDAIIVVDTCRGAGELGSIHRFVWPDSRLTVFGTVSSHGIGLAAALELATTLGRIPPCVVVVAVEGESGKVGTTLSPSVVFALPRLAAAVVAEVRAAATLIHAIPEGTMNEPYPVAIESLKSLAFFAPATDEELRHLAKAARLEQHPGGTVLFREGDHLDHIFIVAEGNVAIEIVGPDRRAKRLQTVGPGELLGWSPILGSTAMTATARALTPVQVVAVNAAAVRAVCDSDPRFGYLFVRRVAAAIASRLSATRLQLLDVFRHELPDSPHGGRP